MKICSITKKSLLIAFSSFLISLTSYSQQETDYLNVNNIKAWFSPYGNFPSKSVPGNYYTYPSLTYPNDSAGTIYTGSMWVGGLDDNGQLHLAGQRFNQTGWDYQPGPLKTDGSGTDSAISALFRKVWKISRSEICEFRANFNNPQPGYVRPVVIDTWPANPVAPGYEGCAPYFDNNGDNYYNPDDGDYPVIFGDEAIFFVFNDYKNHTETGGTPLGIEVRVLAFAHECTEDSAFNNTVFLKIEIKNRSLNNYNNTYLSFFMDFDIGYALNDYVGTDVKRNTIFGYNGVPNDQYLTNPGCYGTHIPAQAFVILKGPKMDSDGIDNQNEIDYGTNGYGFGDNIIDNEYLGLTGSQYFNNTGGLSACTDPSTASEYYGYMRNYWKDNTHLNYSGKGHISDSCSLGPSCRFMFPGLSDVMYWGTNHLPPYSNPDWREDMPCGTGSLPNQPGDRRGVANCGPFTFEAGSSDTILLAFVTGIGTSINGSIASMKQRIDTIKDKICDMIFLNCFNMNNIDCDNNTYPCVSHALKINRYSPTSPSLSIFPNPASKYVEIQLDGVKKKTITYSIYNYAGLLIKNGQISISNNRIDISELPSGIYSIKVYSGDKISSGKFVKY